MNHPDELAWIAWQFVAGELSESEREAFEQRLASDQDAREAVAEAVELTQAVVVAESTPATNAPVPPMAEHGWLAPAVWMSVGAAACLLVMVLYQAATGPNGASIGRPAAADHDQLAEAWTAARDEQVVALPEAWRLPDDRSGPGAVSGSMSDSTAVGSNAADSLEPDVLAIESPDWMVAALEELAELDAAPESEKGSGEREDS